MDRSSVICLSSYRKDNIKNIKKNIIEGNNMSLLGLRKAEKNTIESKLAKHQESKRNSVIIKEKRILLLN